MGRRSENEDKRGSGGRGGRAVEGVGEEREPEREDWRFRRK